MDDYLSESIGFIGFFGTPKQGWKINLKNICDYQKVSTFIEKYSDSGIFNCQKDL